MGVVENISYNTFPEQTDYVGRRVRVCFRYDSDHKLLGTIVRDDAVSPQLTLIHLDDDRYVLSSECQYSLV